MVMACRIGEFLVGNTTMFTVCYVVPLKHSLAVSVDGVNRVRLIGDGPNAVIEKIPPAFGEAVVTTRTYVDPDMRFTVRRSCTARAPPSSSDLIRFRNG